MYQSPNAAPASYTILNFEVDGIDETIGALLARRALRALRRHQARQQGRMRKLMETEQAGAGIRPLGDSSVETVFGRLRRPGGRRYLRSATVRIQARGESTSAHCPSHAF